MDWRPIATAPFDRELEVAVINYDGTHALVFPCRRIAGGWIDAKTEMRLSKSCASAIRLNLLVGIAASFAPIFLVRSHQYPMSLGLSQ